VRRISLEWVAIKITARQSIIALVHEYPRRSRRRAIQSSSKAGSTIAAGEAHSPKSPLTHHRISALPNGTASHESALERDFVTLTSFSDPAAMIRSQPVTIAFDDEGFRRRHTPDFLVTCETSAELVEVKYEHDLKTQWIEAPSIVSK
jgi:hypothetical protein